MVIPIDDEEEEDVRSGQKIVGSSSTAEKESVNEIAVANFEEDEDSFENGPESTRCQSYKSFYGNKLRIFVIS
jgi:hypothetical protein